jgi:hypothetical protein
VIPFCILKKRVVAYIISIQNIFTFFYPLSSPCLLLGIVLEFVKNVRIGKNLVFCKEKILNYYKESYYGVYLNMETKSNFII